ncbi:MAG: glycoside hydrolase N-terminal domain-containing protein [Verrucomicrobiota bacterium]
MRPRFLLLALPASLFAATQPLEIRFDSPPPAQAVWERDAQPVGNGRIGAMVFGNSFAERIQFNDVSLWTGNGNPSGGYGADFGAYQNFGDLFLSMNGAQETPAPVSTSGHTPSEGEDISSAGDANPGTKWCVEHKGKPVIWQIDLGKKQGAPSYSFTSANDVPSRDPRTWTYEGSDDGKTWTVIDKHDGEAPFAQRGETKSYSMVSDKSHSFRHYRFVFQPVDELHFQVGEIALTGVNTIARKSNVEGFSRSLDLATGIHTTRWKHEGGSYQREVFASKPNDVIVIRITADKPGSVAGSVKLTDAHASARTTPDGFSGALSNNLRYAARVKVIAEKTSNDESSVSFSGDSATILLSLATDYALDPQKNFRNGIDPSTTVGGLLEKAAAQSYATLRSTHVADFSKIMGRVNLDLGPPPAGDVVARLNAYKKGGADAHLETLVFQYGRYLLASCSRGFLPANLQGLWNDKNKPAWNSDYHTNINIQMNYWLAEPANLSDCAMPLFDWTDAMIPGSRAATVKAFGANTPGWTMRTSVNIFGGNGWDWNIPASAWLAQHYMEHYNFTGDKEFLKTRVWPLLHDVSEYWLGHLVEKEGKLLVPKGWSPEHGPREDGVAHDQQIIWDLFTNTLAAAEVLGEKGDFVSKVSTAREKLLGPQIGSWGQIMEWTAERPNLEKSGHRHTSHLYAVFPGNQISLTGTPDLAKAAAISLEARGISGDSRRSWTWPWRTAIWARLGRPDKAGEMIRGLLVHNTLPNLYTTHPPFQIDGNLGITAGICETLVQSHAGEVSILPAVPTQWKDGSVTGLKTRGNFEVGMVWKDGKPTAATIKSVLGNPLILRIPGNPATLAITSNGKSATLKPAKNGTFRLPTKKGAEYSVTF